MPARASIRVPRSINPTATDKRPRLSEKTAAPLAVFYVELPENVSPSSSAVSRLKAALFVIGGVGLPG